MFVPILHERMVVSQWPWVSMALIAACLIVFPLTASSPANDDSDRLFEEAIGVAVAFPATAVDPRLMTPELLDRVRAANSEAVYDAGSDGAIAAEVAQAQLDELTRAWLESTERAPVWRLGLVPARFRPPALVTHQFLHGDVFHLLGNLLMFYLTAPLVEDRIGRGKFALAYLGLGALAGAAYALHYPDLYRPLIGASGAISAVVGLFVVLYAGVRLKYLLWIGLPLGVFSAPAWMMFPVWFALQLVLGFEASAATEAGLGGVAYWAHAWGFVGGVGAGFLLRNRSPQIEIAAPDPLAEARRHLVRGRRDEAFRLLSEAVRGGDEREEAIRELWQLARLTGRTAEAAPAFGRLVRGAVSAGDPYRAAERWQELKSALKAKSVDPALSLQVADALDKLGEARATRDEIVADALAGLRATTAPPVIERLVRLATSSPARDVRDALEAARNRSDLPPAVRGALALDGPSASAG